MNTDYTKKLEEQITELQEALANTILMNRQHLHLINVRSNRLYRVYITHKCAGIHGNSIYDIDIITSMFKFINTNKESTFGLILQNGLDIGYSIYIDRLSDGAFLLNIHANGKRLHERKYNNADELKKAILNYIESKHKILQAKYSDIIDLAEPVSIDHFKVNEKVAWVLFDLHTLHGYLKTNYDQLYNAT